MIAEACALLESLARNYACVDGKRRVVFASFDVFLTLIGFEVKGST